VVLPLKEEEDMRRIGFPTLALLVLLAVPAIGQERRAAAPPPTSPTFLWVAISSSNATIRGKIGVRGWDPKGGPSAQTTKDSAYAEGPTGTTTTSSTSNIYRSVPLDSGATGSLELEVSEETGGSAQALGDPILGLDVSLEQIPGGQKRTARTDDAGRFVFENVPPGGYELSWQVRGLAQFQQVWIEPASNAREADAVGDPSVRRVPIQYGVSNLRNTDLEAACRRKCAAEHTNAQGHLNADAYGACLRECMAGAAMCPVPNDDAAHREPCPEDRPACPAGGDITCVRGRWVCIGAADPSR
jgi:hypothetical protein